MTEKEAINKIAEYIIIHKLHEPYMEALKMGMSALGKQIPKAPSQLLKHKDSFDWECPKCHMTYGCCNVKVNYCYECGQAIKWE